MQSAKKNLQKDKSIAPERRHQLEDRSMSKYAIKNPTLRKVKNRGYKPVSVWLGGWYSGWLVKTGRKYQHIFLITTGTVKKFPVSTRAVRDL